MPWIQEHGRALRLGLVLAVSAIVLVAPALFVGNPLIQDVAHRFRPADFFFSLGTDQLGRDLAARLYYGFLNSLILVFLTLATTLLTAIPLGLIAARSPRAEAVLDVLAGAIWAFPTVVLALSIFIGLKGQMIGLKFALLGFFNWVPIYRSVRDLTKQVQISNYVTFARAMGMSGARVYCLQILPNVIPPAFPVIMLNLTTLLEAEFVLSFLGLSVPDPSPTLGGMLRQGIEFLNFNMILLPSSLLAIVLFIVIAFYQMRGVAVR